MCSESDTQSHKSFKASSASSGGLAFLPSLFINLAKGPGTNSSTVAGCSFIVVKYTWLY